jgi:hypothetical protein
MASPNNLYLASHRGFSVLLFLAAAVLGGAEELYAAPTFEITQGEPGPPIVGLTRNRTLGPGLERALQEDLAKRSPKRAFHGCRRQRPFHPA